MTSALNFKCGSVKHIQTWGREPKEYLIFFLTSLDNQNCFACLEKSPLQKHSKEKPDCGLRGRMTWTSLQISHSSASLQNSIWITLWAREQYPQVSQVQKHTQEQQWQDDGAEKEQGWFSHALRRGREQEHHPLQTLVSQVQRKGKGETQHYFCSPCRPL